MTSSSTCIYQAGGDLARVLKQKCASIADLAILALQVSDVLFWGAAAAAIVMLLHRQAVSTASAVCTIATSQCCHIGLQMDHAII